MRSEMEPPNRAAGPGSTPGAEKGNGGPESYPSHLLPRTRDGWVAVLLFLALFLLVEPPILFSVANRVEPWVLGVPFLYAYLFLVYVALIAVLLWVLQRRI